MQNAKTLTNGNNVKHSPTNVLTLHAKTDSSSSARNEKEELEIEDWQHSWPITV